MQDLIELTYDYLKAVGTHNENIDFICKLQLNIFQFLSLLTFIILNQFGFHTIEYKEFQLYVY